MRITRTAPATAAVSPAGQLEGLLLPWSTPATVADAVGGPAYTEEWSPGSLEPVEPVAVYATHRHTETGELERGPLIGRAVDLANGPDGLTGTLALAATPAAQEVRELARTVGAHLSVEVDLDDGPPRPGAHVIRTAGRLTGVAVILPPHRPAFPTAAVTAVRTGETAMSDTAPNPDLDPPEDDDDDNGTDDNGTDDDENGGETVGRAGVLELVRSEVARVAVPRGRVAAHPLARFGRFADAFDAGYNDPDVARELARALADQTTPNNPGVMPPGWVNDVKGVIALGRPIISGLGPNPDPGQGLDINWPYFDGDLDALVGKQAQEKTAITSVRVDLKKGSENLETYAGGSDISYQLIRRSAPSYRDAYLRIMAAAYAAVTDFNAGVQLDAAAGGSVDYDLAADTDGAAFRTAVFTASVMVESATGAPASRVFAATDVFVKYGAALNPAPVVNVSGTASAATLSVDVSGLDVVHARSLPAGTALVTNPQAAAWAEDGPHTVTAEDVEKLGQNVAVWGLGALATFLPAGVVKLSNTVAGRSTRSSK